MPPLRLAGRGAVQIVSRHATAGGLTVWTRCWCGSLQARVADGARVLVVSRGRPA